MHQSIDRLEMGNSLLTTPAVTKDERMMFAARSWRTWWWEAGPVEECGCGIRLGSGIWLLALSTFLNVYIISRISEPLMIKNLGPFIKLQKQKYELGCDGGIATEAYCGELSRVIADSESLLDWVTAYIPVYYAFVVINVCFGLIGVGAAFTKSAKIARAFMYYCPVNIIFILFLAASSPGRLTTADVVSLCVSGFVLVYCSKVTWSFYVRRKAAEARIVDSEIL